MATQFRLRGCTSTPCPVRQGTSLEIEVDFVSHVPATHLVPVVRMGFGGVFVNYNVGVPNACVSLSGAQCPLAANAATTFHLSYPVTTAHPPVPTTVEMTMRNQNNVPIVCGLVDFIVSR